MRRPSNTNMLCTLRLSWLATTAPGVRAAPAIGVRCRRRSKRDVPERPQQRRRTGCPVLLVYAGKDVAFDTQARKPPEHERRGYASRKASTRQDEPQAPVAATRFATPHPAAVLGINPLIRHSVRLTFGS